MSSGADAAERLEEARRLLRAGQAAEAAACLELILAADPADAEAHAMRGVALAMKGEAAAGTRALETAIQLAPQQATYRFNLGQVREQTGDRIGAAAAYQQALQIDPNYARAADAHQRLSGASPHSAATGTGAGAPRADPPPVTAPWLVGAAPEPGARSGSPLAAPPVGASPASGYGALSPLTAVTAGPRLIADAPQIVKSIRLLYGLAIFLLAVGLIGLFMAGAQSHEDPAIQWIVRVVVAGLIVLNAWMLYAVPRGIPTAYYVQMICSGLGLLSFPFGTIIHGYILYYWSKPETRAWFGI